MSNQPRYYDYQDAPGHFRGDMGNNRPKARRIYHLERIDRDAKLAYLEAQNAWGGFNRNCYPLQTVEPIPEKEARHVR